MKKSVFALVLVFILVGCKAKKGLVEANASDDLATQKIIENHYDVKKDFSTAYIRANAKYKDKNQSLSFSAEIRIKKNEMILVSIRFLGITMAKGLITPTEVKYYEKNGGKFFEGDYTTTCVDTNKECAFVNWENGITKCSIEKAYEAGHIDWKKPISCHLYPIRLTQYPEFDMLHYDRWSICGAACDLGNEHQVKVYQFLKEPLIRKYGSSWYQELEENIKLLNQA